MKFIAGCGVSGYLPEVEPVEFNTFDEAKRYLIGEILWLADVIENEEEAENLHGLAQDVNMWNTPQSATCDGLEFWIQLEE